MTKPRKEFLTELFRRLERDGIRWCVLRNYESLYESSASDIDLAAAAEDVPRVEECLAEAASATDHHLVFRTRHVNFSFAYWHAAGGFVRIDVETEIRWRIFPVLSASAVTGLRRKRDAFYIPHPRHESVILLVATLWRGALSDRYRRQLVHLQRQLKRPEELTRTFRSVFGKAGEALADHQSQLEQIEPQPGLWKEARQSLIRNAFRNGPNRRALIRYLSADLRRLWERFRSPPGISLAYISSATAVRPLEDLFAGVNCSHLVETRLPEALHDSAGRAGQGAKLGLQRRLHWFSVLFKGGVFLRSRLLQRDTDLGPAATALLRSPYPRATFACVEDSLGHVVLTHAKTGFMEQLSPTDGDRSRERGIIRFVSAMLALQRQRHEEPASRRGAWVVLVGADATHETEVARALCSSARTRESFSSARYFRGVPGPFGSRSLPLPGFEPEARSLAQPAGRIPEPVSILRSCASSVRAHLGYLLRIRPRLRGNGLVVVERDPSDHLFGPTSPRDHAVAWLRRRLAALVLRPDLVVVLDAGPATRLARTWNSSLEAIQRESIASQRVGLEIRHVLHIDASEPPAEIAERILERAIELAQRPARLPSG